MIHLYDLPTEFGNSHITAVVMSHMSVPSPFNILSFWALFIGIAGQESSNVWLKISPRFFFLIALDKKIIFFVRKGIIKTTSSSKKLFFLRLLGRDYTLSRLSENLVLHMPCRNKIERAT